MAHGLIFGMTESGKSTLAKQLAAGYRRNGIGVLVLDPLHDPEWNADFQTSDVDEFLRVYWESRSCVAFIDEAGDSVGRFDKAMIQTATKGRHWGHVNYYISQRGALLSTTVRDQCSKIFLFTSSLKDSKLHSEEWNAPELMGANALKQGEFYKTGRFSGVEKLRVF